MKRGIHFLPISTIKIDQRQRKEPCDLASLANNIKNRSLNPLVRQLVSLSSNRLHMSHMVTNSLSDPSCGLSHL
jgi:hypothetical protein